ncbi:MAG: SE1561 family protein [Neobacillus sp.]
MGSPTHDKNLQVDFLKQRLNMFLDVLDAIDPEDTDVEDIDRLISMLDDMESKCREFNHRETPESV